MDWFGQFNSIGPMQFLFMGQVNLDPKNNIDKNSRKRRRTHSPPLSTPTAISALTNDITNPIQLTSTHSVGATSSPETLNPPTGAIDLNHAPAFPTSEPEIDETEVSNGDELNELEITVKIGNEIGFDISTEDPILAEIMGENGEINVIQ